MEAKKKQVNRIYLTPEQLKENKRQSKYNWYVKHKEYFQKGGHGYEYMAQKITCEWRSHYKM